MCDGGCGRTFRPGQLRLACGSCDFDLCARCSRSGQVTLALTLALTLTLALALALTLTLTLARRAACSRS